MGLSDTVKDNIVVIVAGAFAAGAGASWAVAEKVKVEPMRDELGRLERSIAGGVKAPGFEEKTIEDLHNKLRLCESRLTVLANAHKETALPRDEPPPQPANLEQLATRLADEKKTSVLAPGASVKGTIADNASREHVFLGTANTPILFTLEQSSKHFWATVNIYDSQGRIQLRNEDFVRPKEEIPFTPSHDDVYIIKLNGTRNYGDYLISMSMLGAANQ